MNKCLPNPFTSRFMGKARMRELDCQASLITVQRMQTFLRG